MIEFVFLGPSKTGSTWIFNALRGHPQVYVPIAKDLYYFDKYYEKGVEWYHSFYSSAPPSSLRGELSHDYFSSPAALERIHCYNPAMKLICCLRNPFDRALSSYRHMRRLGMIEDGFEQAMRTQPVIVQEGLYHTHLRTVYSLFREESVLVLDFDDLEEAPAEFIRSIFSFLNIAPDHQPRELYEKVNPAREPRNLAMARFGKMAAQTLRQLGFPNVVGRLKHSPFVNTLVYKKEGGGMSRQAEQLPRVLVDLYNQELAQLAVLLSKDFSKWQRLL